MFVKKFMGCEIDTGGGITFARMPFLGELWFERNAVVHGRRWADYFFEGSTIQLFFGRRHLVLCPALLTFIVTTMRSSLLQTA